MKNIKQSGYRLIIVDKLENTSEDKLLKDTIKQEFKDITKYIEIVNSDEITEDNFFNKIRGKSLFSIELRTILTSEKYEILVKHCAPSIHASKLHYLNQLNQLNQLNK